MIIIDTQIWVWWVQDIERLTVKQRDILSYYESDGLGVSIISCWEVSKLVEKNRIDFGIALQRWMDEALSYPGVKLLELTPRIAIESTMLPGNFHRDPADQIIVATSRVYNLPLLTADQKILEYPHVVTITEAEYT